MARSDFVPRDIGGNFRETRNKRWDIGYLIDDGDDGITRQCCFSRGLEIVNSPASTNFCDGIFHLSRKFVTSTRNEQLGPPNDIASSPYEFFAILPARS